MCMQCRASYAVNNSHSQQYERKSKRNDVSKDV